MTENPGPMEEDHLMVALTVLEELAKQMDDCRGQLWRAEDIALELRSAGARMVALNDSLES